MSRGRPKVAVIYHFFPHYRRAVVEALARSSSADFIFIGDDHEYLYSIEPAKLSDGVHFRLAPTHLLIRPFMWQWGAITQAIRSEFDIVIMHAVPYWPCTWIGGLAARLMGKRVLFWGHGHLRRPTGLKGFLRRLFYAIPTEHLVYSHLAKSYLIETGWIPERVHVIYNSLDVDEQIRIRDRLESVGSTLTRREIFGDSSVPVVICTTRLIPMRRIDLLFMAVARLNASDIKVNVILVGDGPERERLEKIARDLGLCVHFEGACYDEERIAKLILASNVTVSPGKVGLTVMHSLVYGVPVVTHEDPDDQAPEFEAVIPGKTGSVFQSGDVESLSDAIRPWVQAQTVPPDVQRACRDLIKRFWNPTYQRRAIERAVLGYPANDLFDAEEDRVHVK
jgi:glycosyltransferase involved in cell wall biosynthesis